MKHNTRTPQPSVVDSPPPTPLTLVQCRTVIGGTVGCLCTIADPSTVRAALRLWADSDAAWEVLGVVTKPGSDVRRALDNTVDDVLDGEL